MEISTQKINTDVKFNPEDNETIVSKIKGDWDSWDDDRQPQITSIEKVAKLLDSKPDVEETDDTNFNELKEKLALKDATIKSICISSIAHDYNSTFKTPSQMFNVELENELGESESAKFAHIQKAALLDVLKKSKAKKEFRKAVSNWRKKGEMIFYINWKQDFELQRRKVPKLFLGQFDIGMKEWQVQKQLKYDGATIKCIEPENFVFDTSRADDFENAPKIYKSWQTYSEIANNENFKKYLKSADLEKLKELVDNKKKDNSNVKTDSEDSKGVKDNMLEVLQYEGDISITRDGKSEFYPNMKIVIIGRKFVACFEYNPNIIGSFVWCPYEVDPDTGRGISFLNHLASYAEATTELMNKINTGVGLSVRRCWLAPKGALSGEQKLEENGIIEYDPAFGGMNPNAMLTPIDTTSGLPIAMQYLQWLEGKFEQAVNRFKYSTGNTSVKQRTAKEATMTQAGQDATQGFDNDILAETVITVIEKIGQLMANNQDQEIPIKYKDATGAEQIGAIDDAVRQGNYVYTIGDTQSSVEKKMNGLEALQALPQIAQYAMQTNQGILSVPELLNQWGAIYEQENPTKLLIQPQPIGGQPIGTQGTTGMPEIPPTMPDANIQGMAATLPPENIQ